MKWEEGRQRSRVIGEAPTGGIRSFIPLHPVVFPRGRFASTVGADSELLSDGMPESDIHKLLLRRSDRRSGFSFGKSSAQVDFFLLRINLRQTLSTAGALLEYASFYFRPIIASMHTSFRDMLFFKPFPHRAHRPNTGLDPL